MVCWLRKGSFLFHFNPICLFLRSQLYICVPSVVQFLLSLFSAREKFSARHTEIHQGRICHQQVPEAPEEAAGICGLCGLLHFLSISVSLLFFLLLTSRNSETIPDLLQISFLSGSSLWRCHST